MNKETSTYSKFLSWRVKNISNRNLIYILSLFIGFFAGMAAVVIKNAVHYIRDFLTANFGDNAHNYLYFLYPIVGIAIAVLFMKYVLRKWVDHGIPGVLYAISKKAGKMDSHNMFSSIITSSLTVGFGGSVGLEGPTVATGAGIGSNIGKFFRLNYSETVLLLGAASAGAMSAIFKAPITGIVFVLEVIMIDMKLTSLIPLLLSSATAALTSYAFLGKDVIYSVKINYILEYSDIPMFVILAVVTGLFSLYYYHAYIAVSSIFSKLNKWWVKLLIGGAVLGLLIFLFPSLYGEGYENINGALHGSIFHLFKNTFYFDFQGNILFVFLTFLLVILFKVIATSTTFSAGGVGGVFAPTLFIGSNLGLLFALVSNHYFHTNLDPTAFALIGMAGMIAAVLHGPLTAIFLIAEITNGYQLFIPLMIVSSISYLIIRIFNNTSIYTYQLARRGELLTHNKDKAALTLLDLEKHIETNFRVITIDYTLGQLISEIEKSSRNLFPIVDKDQNFEGLVFLNDIRSIIFKPELYDSIKVKDIMMTFDDNTIVDVTKDKMEDVLNKLEATHNYNLPVVNDGKYLGFISRANVLTSYRNIIYDMTKE